VSPTPAINASAYEQIKQALKTKPHSNEELAELTGLGYRTVCRYLVRFADELVGTGFAVWIVEPGTPQRRAIVDIRRVGYGRPEKK